MRGKKIKIINTIKKSIVIGLIKIKKFVKVKKKVILMK